MEPCSSESKKKKPRTKKRRLKKKLRIKKQSQIKKKVADKKKKPMSLPGHRSNPCQSSPSLTILVPLWFIIISLTFFYICKVLFSGFLEFRGNFVNGRNNSKYRDVAPLTPKSYDQHPCLLYGCLTLQGFPLSKKASEVVKRSIACT